MLLLIGAVIGIMLVIWFALTILVCATVAFIRWFLGVL